jgi:hypothetical protein
VGNPTFTYNTKRTGSGQVTDPYGSLAVEGEPSTCTATSLSIHGDTTLTPGTYCGGIDIKGGTTSLSAGTYYIDGGNFSLSGQGNVVGNGVTLIFTNSSVSGNAGWGSLNVTGGGSMDITAPSSGYYEGIAMYQDRNTPSGCTDKFYGSTSDMFDGVVYAPSCALEYGGNNSTDTSSACTKLISNTIVFHGTPSIGSNCASTAAGGNTKAIGGAGVVLIE